MCQCFVWVNARELVLLEQWKTGWVSYDFQLSYKSVTEFILNVPALLFIWKIIFKIRCFLATSFLLGVLCDSSLNHRSVIFFLSCQTLNKQTSFWVTGKWWDLYQKFESKNSQINSFWNSQHVPSLQWYLSDFFSWDLCLSFTCKSEMQVQVPVVQTLINAYK